MKRGPYIIQVGKMRNCSVCGKWMETRPYGPKGEDICFPCAMKPEYRPIVDKNFKRLINGEEAE